jgi:hypothetical protein
MQTVKESGTGPHSRVWPRHDCELRGTCTPLAGPHDSGPSWSGKVQDISLGGVGLVLTRRFEAGTVLSLELESRATRTTQRFLVRVVRVLPAPDHQWLLGCMLLSRLSQEKLSALLGGAGPTPEPAAEPEEMRPAVVEDVIFRAVSRATGLGAFRARRFHPTDGWPLAAGTVLTLALDGTGKDATQLQLRVQECVQRGKGWVVRYELLGTAAPAVRRLLGEARR